MANKRTTQSTKAKTTPTKTARPSRKPAAKAAVRTKVEEVKRAPVQTATPSKSSVSSSTTSASSAVRFKKSYVIAGLVLLLLVVALVAGRSYLVAATVNGEPITRLSLVTELEKSAGKQTLEAMVTKTLIRQEAKKQNGQVTDQQINDETKKISYNLKQQGQELNQVLAMQGLTEESLKDQIRVQQTVEILLGREIVVTDKEVDDYIASNSAVIPTDVPAETTKTNVEQQLRQQKLSEKFQTWLQKLRQDAKINYLVNY